MRWALLHPLHVESVAWIAERKDVLSAFFWMLTLYAYARYAARPGPVRYALTLIAFSLGLMAKPMLVTLPLVLFLLDYWPFAREYASWRKYLSGAVGRSLCDHYVVHREGARPRP